MPFGFPPELAFSFAGIPTDNGTERFRAVTSIRETTCRSRNETRYRLGRESFPSLSTVNSISYVQGGHSKGGACPVALTDTSFVFVPLAGP
jgi:hypothetical protein